jgi:hypothetical protein
MSAGLIFDSAPFTAPPLSILELDQDDIVSRLTIDPYFQAGVPVLEQRRGITESDVQVAIGTVNQQSGLVGTVVIVLMPRLAGQDPNAPGPRYTVRYPIQIIDWPVVRRQSQAGGGGSGVSAEEIADRVREIIHLLNFGRGQTVYFDRMEPVTVPDGMVSYILTFKRLGTDAPPTGCAAVGISPSAGTHPVTVTLTCATAGAAIYYTIDGSYPGSINPTATLYTTPFSVSTAATTVRAAAELSGYQQSQVISQVTYS